MKRVVLKALLVAAPLAYAALYATSSARNPYAGVEWLEDAPGAGDRYRTFTPVLGRDHRQELGPTVGADYGRLYFEDLNHDGLKEAIVETDASFTFEEHTSERHVLQARKDAGGQVRFTLLESRELAD